MFNRPTYTAPRKCCNGNCKAPFYQSSHKGFLPKSEMDVYVVMQCPKCRDKFMIPQMIAMAHEYYKSLPTDPSIKSRGASPITLAEMKALRERMEKDDNLLSTLFDK